jgi:hypothetical protein
MRSNIRAPFRHPGAVSRSIILLGEVASRLDMLEIRCARMIAARERLRVPSGCNRAKYYLPEHEGGSPPDVAAETATPHEEGSA